MRDVAAAAELVAALLAALPRWLRVAQREHYLPGSVLRFWWRWLLSSRLNLAVGTTTLALGVAGGFVGWPLALAAALGVVVWPIGLSIRGRTSALAWTRRLRTVALVSVGTGTVALAVVGVVLGFPEAAGIVAVSTALLVDVVLALTAPLEARSARRYVRDAVRRVEAVRPRVVAITGSYGKTSTKQHVRDLTSGQFRVVASPASFNNQMGLARTVNELLVPGTEVLVAEMGAYGPGEIASMCEWLPPDIAVITAIGPVHLERFGSLDRTLAAKAEITLHASTVVLNVDDPMLATLAGELDGRGHEGHRVVRCGTDTSSAEVTATVEGDDLVCRAGAWTVRVPAPDGVNLTNVACALGVARELGVDHRVLETALHDLHTAEHRGELQSSPSGVTVIDDTFSSNPAGARAAVERLRTTAAIGRRVVITPGMVELGAQQDAANLDFARLAGDIADLVIIVGATNRAALREGVRGAQRARTVEVRTRDHAVAWVREHGRPGDVILYENDLPDHYA